MTETTHPTTPLYQDAVALNEVAEELRRARASHPPLHSAHEGHSVILEELRELEEEVFLKRELRDMAHMRKEAIQLAAMAVRFASDIVPRKEPV